MDVIVLGDDCQSPELASSIPTGPSQALGSQPMLDSQASPCAEHLLSNQSSNHSSPVIARKRVKRQAVALDLDLEVTMDTSDEEDALEVVQPLPGLGN